MQEIITTIRNGDDKEIEVTGRCNYSDPSVGILYDYVDNIVAYEDFREVSLSPSMIEEAEQAILEKWGEIENDQKY